MFDAILCELEGVLADTASLRRDALQASLNEEGIALSDREFRDACAALPVPAAVASALALLGAQRDEVAVELIARRAERHFARAAGRGLLLAPGAREFVESVQGCARLALVTRARRREANFALSLAGLDGAFECLVAAEDAAEQKPSAAPYERALERLARRRPVRRERAVALEDGLAGIRAARAASLRCVVVAGHDETLPAHVALEADALVPSLAGQTPVEIEALLSHPEEIVG